MKQSWLKPLLVPALATSLLVGCTGTPTAPNPASSDTQQEQAITSSAVKDFLAEIKQSLASMQTLNGATREFASALPQPSDGAAIDASEDPWTWETTFQDGVETGSRHVIERNTAGAVVTDIRSTYSSTYTDGMRTYTQEDVVSSSIAMAPGTYLLSGKTTWTGSISEDDYLHETEKTLIYTPVGGASRQVALKSTIKKSGSVLTLSGVLPDGSTITFKSSQTPNSSDSGPSPDLQNTLDLKLTRPNGKVITVESLSDTRSSQQDQTYSYEGKGFYQIALDNLMQVRFDIDIHIESKPSSSEDSPPEERFIRNLITAELRDGTGKRIAEIPLEASTDPAKPPSKGTLTLPGESPTELDVNFLLDFMHLPAALSTST